MANRRRRFMSLVMSLALVSPAWSAGPVPRADEEARIVHILNRLGYGPRPGDVEKIKKIGLEKWTSAQLRPERIPDPEVERRLASLKTVSLSSSDLMEGYDLPREVKREIQKKRVELENASEEEKEKARREFMRQYAGRLQGRPRQVVEELQSAKLLRAVYSERQLDEVLVDFWLNHFNVYANKGPERFLVGEYERDVIRPHAWGKFEDLLRATAESPAMLFYLDNWLSADPNAEPMAGRGLGGLRRRDRSAGFAIGDNGARPALVAGKGRKRGLNENYAREIMELHTLGVDGGYTQQDVMEVARCFTGWTIRRLRDGNPEFVFDSRTHDRQDKRVLGRVIKAGGKDEGDAVIHLLATHPSTAHFISLKLARRFVSDEPPAALVARAAETFRKTNGDIRAVVTTIVTSPEFLSPQFRSVKVKTPLEFVVSAVRGAGAEVQDARELARRVAQMGMPLYQQQPPTGYKDTAEAWVSTSGLLARLNFALDLATGKVKGVGIDPARLAPQGTAASALVARLLPGGLSESTRKTLHGEGEAASSDPAEMAGLILGSPEFQRR